MKRLFLAVSLLLVLCSFAVACEPSTEVLADMGLTDMQPVDAYTVRGQGYATVYGRSYAVVSRLDALAVGTNGYRASSRTRWAAAGGENESFAQIRNVTAVAGGYSTAYAK